MSHASYWRDEAARLQAAFDVERAARLSAEAKLAQAVEALATLETHLQGLIGMAEQSKLYASRQCATAEHRPDRGEIR
jgi:hypothetical protein